MSYSKTNWVDGSAPAVNAKNLNKIEQGIYENSLDIIIANQNVSELDSRIKNINTELQNKADKEDVYTQSEVDTAIKKAKSEAVTEADSMLDEYDEVVVAKLKLKADKEDTYTKQEIDEMFKNISNNNVSELIEFNQMNDTVKAYINNVEYTDDYSTTQINDYCDRVTDYRKDQPFGCEINLQNACTLQICCKNSVITTDSNAGKNTIYNLTPRTLYTYNNILNNKTSESGTLKATDTLRMIKADSVNNVRDLGGLTCDGGYINYNKLIRGGELNGEHDINISQEDIATFKDVLNIKAELDLRGSWELDLDTDDTSDDITSSAIDNVEYKNVAIEPYKNAVDLSFNYYTKTVSALKYIFECVKNNKAVYFHCVSGADRTGTIAFIIEALLGVSQSDIDKDYELTSFTNEANIKRDRTSLAWTNLVEYIKSFDGDTLADKTASWLILAGFELDEINDFRKKTINGNPAELLNKVDYNCKSISISQEEIELNVNESANITINILPSWATNTVVCSADNDNVNLTITDKSVVIKAIKAGTSIITATCNNLTASCEITVLEKEVEYKNVVDGIEEGTKISSSDYKTETLNEINYAASDYVSVTNYNKYMLTNDYDKFSTENIANEYLIFYDENKNYISKSDTVRNKANAVSDSLSGEIPSQAAYMRLRAYCSHGLENVRSEYFKASKVLLAK